MNDAIEAVARALEAASIHTSLEAAECAIAAYQLTDEWRGMASMNADLASLVRRLCFVFRGEAASEDEFHLINRAQDYLKRHGLQGTPIRDEYTEGEAMTPETLEAVAKALCCFKYGLESSDSYDSLADWEKDYWREHALAAIAAYEQSQEYLGMVEAKRQRDELIYQVSIVHPSETRYETALRYMRRAEHAINPPSTRIDTAIAQGDGHE